MTTRIFFICFLFLVAGCDQDNGTTAWSDCTQAIAGAPDCSGDPFIDWPAYCDGDTSDRWRWFQASCGNLEESARRSNCSDEFRELLACIEQNGTCL